MKTCRDTESDGVEVEKGASVARVGISANVKRNKGQGFLFIARKSEGAKINFLPDGFCRIEKKNEPSFNRE